MSKYFIDGGGKLFHGAGLPGISIRKAAGTVRYLARTGRHLFRCAKDTSQSIIQRSPDPHQSIPDFRKISFVLKFQFKLKIAVSDFIQDPGGLIDIFNIVLKL